MDFLSHLIFVMSHTAEFALDTLRVILSAPSVALIIAVIVLFLFRTDFKALLERIATIRMPGGSEFLLTQSQQNAREPESTNSPIPSPPEQNVEVPTNLTLTPDQSREIDDLIRTERLNARLWEYEYLNYHLVPMTQRVLDFIAGSPTGQSENLIDTLLRPSIPVSAERLAILTALESHHLISNENGLIAATPKGREYINFRGPLGVAVTPPANA